MTEAFLAWVRYYVETEAFDRTLPGVWSDRGPDVWLPVGNPARHACEENAQRVFKQIPNEHRLDSAARRDALDFTSRHHTRDATAGDVMALAEKVSADVHERPPAVVR